MSDEIKYCLRNDEAYISVDPELFNHMPKVKLVFSISEAFPHLNLLEIKNHVFSMHQDDNPKLKSIFDIRK